MNHSKPSLAVAKRPERNGDWPTLIAGFGSPNGDDQAGWLLVDLLKRRCGLPARLLSVVEPTLLLESLENCQRLIVVDSCCAGNKVGTIVRLEWPDRRIVECHSHSSHGMGVAQTLELADRLGRLPPWVKVYGIELEDCTRGRGVTPKVAQAASRLAQQIADQLGEASHA